MRYIKKKAIHNRLFIVRISQAAFRKPVFIEDFSDDDPCTQTSFAVFRLFGGSAEGVSYAIIFCNLLVPMIERVTRHPAFGKGGKKA